LIAARQEPFKDFKDFITQLEAQFGDPSPKATAIGKLKNSTTRILFCGRVYITIQSRGFTDRLRRHRVNRIFESQIKPRAIKSIYRLPVMPENLKEWYEWAQKLDWQYRQEQTESKLLGHSHATHKTHRRQEEQEVTREHGQQAAAWHSRWPTPATPNAHAPQTHQQTHQYQLQNSDAMDVDRGGRRPPLKCYKLWKIRSYCEVM